MADDRQQRQAQRALIRLARKRPLAAAALAVLLVLAAAFGWAGSGTAFDGAGPSAAGGPSASADASDSLQSAEVVRVVDGDTLKVRLADGEENYVRLVGVDTPESVASDKSRNCEEGRIAADFTKSIVAQGQTVWLSRDVSDADRYGRWLRYVWLEPPEDPTNEDEIAAKMLNAVLVREGYAQAKRYKPDTTLHDLFERWGDEAVREGRGVTGKWA